MTRRKFPGIKKQMGDMTFAPPSLVLPSEIPNGVVHHHAKMLGLNIVTIRRNDKILVWRVPE